MTGTYWEDSSITGVETDLMGWVGVVETLLKRLQKGIAPWGVADEDLSDDLADESVAERLAQPIWKLPHCRLLLLAFFVLVCAW